MKAMDYQIVAAVIRRKGEILLVRHQGPDDSSQVWALPGGTVGAGEMLHEALAREMFEQTGMRVKEPGSLLFAVQTQSQSADAEPGADPILHGQRTTTFVFAIPDSDAIAKPVSSETSTPEAEFMPLPRAIELLENNPSRTVREPVTAYLRGQAQPGSFWIYRHEADSGDTLVARFPSPVPPAKSPSRTARHTAETSPTIERTMEYKVFVLGCMALIAGLIILIIIGIIAVSGWKP